MSCLFKLDIKMFAWCVPLLRNLCTEVKLYILQNAHKNNSKFCFLFIMDAVSDFFWGEGGSKQVPDVMREWTFRIHDKHGFLCLISDYTPYIQ